MFGAKLLIDRRKTAPEDCLPSCTVGQLPFKVDDLANLETQCDTVLR